MLARRAWRILLLPLLLLYVWLVWPSATHDLPYFYREDEAHHYNRVLNMFKSSSLDPQYFHKPSLHFYLRLPGVAATYLWMKQRGEIASRSELVTKDPYGIADYAFSASHHSMAFGARLFGVALGALIIIIAALIAEAATHSASAAFWSAALCAVSPALLEYAPVVGVDTPMTLFVLLGTWLSLRALQRFSRSKVLLAAFICGLAVSCKYNAAPIGVAPLLVCWLRGERAFWLLSAVCFAGLAGFLAGSPFILVHPQLFWRELSYEVWHYAVAGHVGNEGKPGLAQLLHFGNWFGSVAAGWGTMALSGVALLLVLDRKRAPNPVWIVACFPVLFLLLMCAQKANFVRNMVVLIPFLAILAAMLLERIARPFFARGALISALGVVLAIQPLRLAYSERVSILTRQESRLAVERYVRANVEEGRQLAIAGEIQLTPLTYTLAGVTRINQKLARPLDLYLEGFDRVLLGPGQRAMSESAILELERDFPGVNTSDRVVHNPHVESFSFSAGPEFEATLLRYLQSVPQLQLNLGSQGSAVCSSAAAERPSDQEPYCWLNSRRQLVKFSGIANLIFDLSAGSDMVLELELMSPWKGQSVALSYAEWNAQLALDDDSAGQFKAYQLRIPAQYFSEEQRFQLAVGRIMSPAEQHLSADKRRLGIAIRKVTVQ